MELPDFTRRSRHSTEFSIRIRDSWCKLYRTCHTGSPMASRRIFHYCSTVSVSPKSVFTSSPIMPVSSICTTLSCGSPAVRYPSFLMHVRTMRGSSKLVSEDPDPDPEITPPRQHRVQFIKRAGDQSKNPFNPSLYPEEVRYDDPLAGLTRVEQGLSQEIIQRINTQIQEESHGRLFAVVHLSNQQFRVTDEDIIMLKGTYHLAVGEKVKFEKILAVGSSDFTLLGRPILDRTLVNVDATCVEKTLNYPEVRFIHIKPIPLRIRKFRRMPLTMIRINRVNFKRLLNEVQNPDDVVHNIH